MPPFTDAVLPFVNRLRAKEFKGFASFQTLADAQHKSMLSLAAIQYGLTRSGIFGWLKNHPDEVRALPGLTHVATMLRALPLIILPSEDAALLTDAATICKAHGLLTNDALIVALMRREGITNLATNDDDFDRVPGITVWKPRT